MAEFARGAEKRILHGFLGRAQGVTDGSELQALIVLHLKNNAFARGQALHGYGDARLDFFADESALGVQRRALLALAFEEIGDALLVEAGIQFGSLIFGARLTAAQVVQANVGYDAVEPGVKAALEAERRTNSSKAARLPVCASATRARSSRWDKEITEARAASVLPERPL